MTDPHGSVDQSTPSGSPPSAPPPPTPSGNGIMANSPLYPIDNPTATLTPEQVAARKAEADAVAAATKSNPGGLAQLNDLVWRINPNAIDWNFSINTAVIPTIGGRVVQVLGATLDDLTISGDLGQDVGTSAHDGPGIGWRLAQDFVKKMHDLIALQSADSNTYGQSAPPLIFQYPARGYAFDCYIKSYADPDGGSYDQVTGKFSYKYVLKLKIVNDRSPQSSITGNGVLDIKTDNAVNAYLTRLYDGLGWKEDAFNDPTLTLDIYGKPPLGDETVHTSANDANQQEKDANKLRGPR